MKNGIAKKLIGEIKPGSFNLVDFRSAVPSRKPGSVTRTPHLIVNTVANKQLQLEMLNSRLLNQTGPYYTFAARIIGSKKNQVTDVTGYMKFKDGLLQEAKIYSKEFK